MKTPSDPPPSRRDIHDQMVGLGDRSIRKSHYPALQKRVRELERFRLLLDQVTEAIIVAEADDLRIIDANQSAERLFGRARAEILSRRVTDFAPPELAALLPMPETHGDGGIGTARVEFIRPDGGSVHAQVNIHRRALGDERYLVLTAIDIGGRIAFETALERAKEEADHANLAKSRFLANISHEFRTPLNAIIGFAELVRRETFGPIGSAKYAEYMDDIFASARHLLQLVTDTLDISRIEVGSVALRESRLDLGQEVAQVVKMTRDLAERHAVTVENSIPRAFPHLRADRIRVHQILLNVLTNAVKFNRPGGHVVFATRTTAENGVVLEVTDDGVGVRAEDLPFIFEPFGRGDDPTIRSRDGTGLGLCIVKRLVEAHDGVVEFRSAVGLGSRLTIRFPPDRTCAG